MAMHRPRTGRGPAHSWRSMGMQYSNKGLDANAMRCIAAALDGGVLTITLNRPEQGNAIDAAMCREMTALLSTVASDDAVRVVILRGAGDNFCAGLDSSDFFDPDGRDTAELRALREAEDEWRIRALRRLPQPV